MHSRSVTPTDGRKERGEKLEKKEGGDKFMNDCNFLFSCCSHVVKECYYFPETSECYHLLFALNPTVAFRVGCRQHKYLLVVLYGGECRRVNPLWLCAISLRANKVGTLVSKEQIPTRLTFIRNLKDQNKKKLQEKEKKTRTN